MIFTNWRKRYEEKCKESDFHKEWSDRWKNEAGDMLHTWMTEQDAFRDLVRDFAQYHADTRDMGCNDRMSLCELLQRASDMFPGLEPTDHNEPKEQR